MINITDLPITMDEDDKLGIDVYKNALLTYIQKSETPMTISIQGEWGSGKTSLMNMLQHRLDKDNTPIIWTNTWEYSMVGEDSAAMSVFESIIDNLLNFLADNSGKLSDKFNAKASDIKKIVGSITKGVGKLALSTTIGVNSNSAVDDISKTFSRASSINKLKKELTELVVDILAIKKYKSSHNNKIVFFIDDLDRLNPEIAINILEILKNVFDLHHCLFVLAIDYEVIVKGLSVKFGDRDLNEREYRQFFDKIIQLPFSLPIGKYKSEEYIKDIIAAEKIKYFTPSEFDDNSSFLMKILNYSVGGNPRAIKRMANYLSLVSSIITTNDINEKLIHFTLIALQISYPFVYEMLAKEPDFKNWSSNTFKFKDIVIPKEMQEKQEFDEEWEIELLKGIESSNNSYFQERSFDISSLLNAVFNKFEKDNQYASLIENALVVASITNVSTRHSVDTKPSDDMSENWTKLSKEIHGIKKIKSKTQIVSPANTKWKIRISINQNSSRIGILVKMIKSQRWSELVKQINELDENIEISDNTKEKNIYFITNGGFDNFDDAKNEIIEKYNILKEFAEKNL